MLTPEEQKEILFEFDMQLLLRQIEKYILYKAVNIGAEARNKLIDDLRSFYDYNPIIN